MNELRMNKRSVTVCTLISIDNLFNCLTFNMTDVKFVYMAMRGGRVSNIGIYCNWPGIHGSAFSLLYIMQLPQASKCRQMFNVKACVLLSDIVLLIKFS